MGEGAFFKDEAKKRAAQAVKAAESQTSAEIVIAVRKRSGNYRATDYHFGFIVMAFPVLYMLVHPTRVFAVETIALDGVLAFAIGALLSANVHTLRRLLVRRKTLTTNVTEAGRATFYELGISRTSGRNGILIFVSAFERMCTVVPDVGIDPKKLGAEWASATGAIENAAKKLEDRKSTRLNSSHRL